MRIEDLLDGPESLEAISELIEILRNENNAVFIGAGVSMNSGYKSWETVIQDLAKNCEFEIEIDHNPIEIAENCFLKYPERYHDFLHREFGENLFAYNNTILQLKELGFQNYITTNFDPCLYQTIPTLSFIAYPIMESNHDTPPVVTYLHGKAFKLEGESEDNLMTCLESIIFRSGNYNDAYATDGSGSGVCHDYLQNICHKYNLVFLGFSFLDTAILNSVKIILSKAIQRDKQRRRYESNVPSILKKIFIFRESGEVLPNDKLLETFSQVRYIRYRKMDNYHQGLNKVLHYLLQAKNINKYASKLLEF